MTRKTLDKLDEKYKTFLENRKRILDKTSKPDDVKGEIRGYLRGLADCEVITEIELRVLYSYYTM